MGKYDLKSLLNELEKTESSSGNSDYQSDFWKPTIEKGEEEVEYVIRFLPNPDAKTNFPWVERAAHMFNFPNSKFMYEPCVKKSKKEPCYICEEVSRLYGTGDPSQEKIGSKRYSRKRFFHNILVVKDPRENGKNEGKVMIYECGQQIHEKCLDILKNDDLDAEERLYFHPTVGTDFKMRITWKSNYPNYDKSLFARKTSPLTVGGEDLGEDESEKFIEENCKGLNERLLGEKVFKDYDTLKDLYLNQGNAADKKPKKDKDAEEVEESKEEEMDVTVKNEKIQAQNPSPKKRVEPENEKEDEPPFDVDEESTDEDAELERLLSED